MNNLSLANDTKPLSFTDIYINPNSHTEQKNTLNKLEDNKIKTFIANKYEQSFGANLTHFLPNLMVEINLNDDIDYAYGFCPSNLQPLFLERYLPNPIDQILSKKYGKSIERQDIVEVGNLVIANLSDSANTFLNIITCLKHMGFTWIVCTTTRMLRVLFHHVGILPDVICRADKSILSVCEQQQWGSYYETNPKILVGNIDLCIQQVMAKQQIH